MTYPVIDQVIPFADMEENGIGVMPAEELRTYAARDIPKALVRNREVAMGDGAALRDMVDIDGVIEAPVEIKGTLVKGLGERLDGVHPRTGGSSLQDGKGEAVSIRSPVRTHASCPDGPCRTGGSTRMSPAGG